MVLKQVATHLETDKIRTTFHTIHQNKLQMNRGSTCKTVKPR